MRFLKRSFIGLVLAIVALGLLLGAGWLIRDALSPELAEPARPGQGAEERIFTTTVQTVEPTEIVPILTAYGEVRTLRSVELRAEAAGTVIWLAEGLASYWQNLLRARTGLLTPQQAWQQLDAGFGRGRSVAGDQLSLAELSGVMHERRDAVAQRGVGDADDQWMRHDGQPTVRPRVATRPESPPPVPAPGTA